MRNSVSKQRAEQVIAGSTADVVALLMQMTNREFGEMRTQLRLEWQKKTMSNPYYGGSSGIVIKGGRIDE